jgi:endoglucanase
VYNVAAHLLFHTYLNVLFCCYIFVQIPLPIMTKLLFIPLLLCAFTIYAQTDSAFVGINICGPEFGEKNFPGVLNTDYKYPNIDEIEYFAAKGFPVISLPVKWERIQHQLYGELDVNEINELKRFITNCKSYNEKVIITLQNFGRYKNNKKELVLGKDFPADCLQDVWKKMAAELSGMNNIYGFDIMNEPFGIKEKTWFSACQQSINAIRSTDTITNIIIDGLSYSYASDWTYFNDKFRFLKDPSDKLIFDAHCYFDEDHSGHYEKRFNRYPDPQIGVKRVKPFVNWLEQNHLKGMIGEFGIPADEQKWFVIMDNFLQYLQQHHIPSKYWAAGEWWNEYHLSLQPENGIDKPQMAIIQKYISPQKTF